MNAWGGQAGLPKQPLFRLFSILEFLMIDFPPEDARFAGLVPLPSVNKMLSALQVLFIGIVHRCFQQVRPVSSYPAFHEEAIPAIPQDESREQE